MNEFIRSGSWKQLITTTVFSHWYCCFCCCEGWKITSAEKSIFYNEIAFKICGWNIHKNRLFIWAFRRLLFVAAIFTIFFFSPPKQFNRINDLMTIMSERYIHTTITFILISLSLVLSLLSPCLASLSLSLSHTHMFHFCDIEAKQSIRTFPAEKQHKKSSINFSF